MEQSDSSSTPSTAQLLTIIKAQQDITRYGLDLNAVMSLVLEKTQALTFANAGAIELVDGNKMVYRAVSGAASHMLGLTLDRESSLSGECVKQQAVLYCEDSETDARVDRNACRSVGLRSMIVAPLLRDKDVIGVLKVMSPSPCAFNGQHIAVLQLMSDLIAAAMYNAGQQQQDVMFHKASTDYLTGIANRAMFMEHSRNALALAIRESKPMAVLMLDVDGLKLINDTYGHNSGDAAIKEIALRISEQTRQSDLAARIGGDEFAVVLTGIRTREDAGAFVKRLSERCDQPLIFAGNQLKAGASIGAACYPDDGDNIDQLMAVADQRMYAEKRQRKDL